MAKKQTKLSLYLRNVLFALLGIIGLCMLLYGFIVVASLWGRESVRVENIDRKYRVYVPSSYQETEPAPLVLVFHMLTGSGRTMEWITHFNKVAEQKGFIMVYPDGYKGSWAEGTNLYAADQDHINDIAFVSGLIAKIEEQYAINPHQIYATGFSSGGFMVQRLGCEMAGTITAIATVGATLPENIITDCNPPEPLSVLMINGVDDHSVPWAGNPEYASVPATTEYWINHNKCDSAPEKLQEPDLTDDGTRVERETYTACAGGASVVLYSIIGGGHAWPGGNKAAQLWGLNGKISQDIDASAIIGEFFAEAYK